MSLVGGINQKTNWQRTKTPGAITASLEQVKYLSKPAEVGSATVLVATLIHKPLERTILSQ